jgi:hypothetical protein
MVRIAEVDLSKEYAHKYYLEHKEKIIANARKNERIYETRVRGFIRDYLSAHPCVDCGEADIVVLDFDHIDGTKEMSVSQMIRWGFSLDRIKAEIAKCEVRCSNCHRKRHAIERGFWRV